MTSSSNKRKMKSFDELFAEAEPDKLKESRLDTPHATDVRWLGVDRTGGSAAAEDRTYWWPVKAVDENEVEVYGDDGHGFQRRTKVDKNALPKFRERGAVRYDADTFYEHAGAPATLVDAFNAALKSAGIDDEDSEDGLPDVSIAHYVATPSATQSSQVTATDSSPVRAHSQPKSQHTPRHRANKPCGPDPEINIDEKEGVLSRYYKSSKTHWPARVIGFEEGLYVLEFNDGVVKKLPRHWFFTSAEKDFRTCELGLLEKLSASKARRKRSSSGADEAIPSEMPPVEVFGQLDIAEQVKLCLPIVNCIVTENYRHALPKHSLFIKGGENRKYVAKQVCYGAFSSHRDEIVEIIREHLKPGEEKKERRVVGGDAYEQLSRSERVAYMLDVLFPEVLIQIVIHSEGLDKDNENDYNKANQILKDESADRDWIDRIYAQRHFQEETKATKAPEVEEQLYHTSGRPLRNILIKR